MAHYETEKHRFVGPPPKHRQYTVSVGWWHCEGQAPHFTLRVEEADSYGRFMSSGGTLPEGFDKPEWAVMEKWHGFAWREGPIHYVANAGHHLATHYGCNPHRQPSDANTDWLEVFKGFVVFGAVDGDVMPEMPDVPRGLSTEEEHRRACYAVIRERVRVWCEARREALIAAFEADLATAGVAPPTSSPCPRCLDSGWYTEKGEGREPDERVRCDCGA